MCVAIIVPAHKPIPSLEILTACERANSDGGGIAFIEDGVVQFVKGISAAMAHNILSDVPKDKPRLIHFRIATAGGRATKFCHPFPVSAEVSVEESGSARAVLIHNGHLSGWEAMLPGGEKSAEWTDTRLMAKFVHKCSVAVLPLFAGQRVAVLTARGSVHTRGTWDEKNDIYYSNLTWEYSSSSKSIYDSDEEWRYPENKSKSGKKEKSKGKKEWTWDQYIARRYGAEIGTPPRNPPNKYFSGEEPRPIPLDGPISSANVTFLKERASPTGVTYFKGLPSGPPEKSTRDQWLEWREKFERKRDAPITTLALVPSRYLSPEMEEVNAALEATAKEVNQAALRAETACPVVVADRPTEPIVVKPEERPVAEGNDMLIVNGGPN